MLHVHRSDRADGLIEALRALLADPPADPFAREVVARADARDGALAHAAAVACALGHLRERRLPVPAPADRRRGGGGVRDRAGRGPVAAGAAGVAAAGGRRRALAEPWLQPLATHADGRPRAPLRRRPPPRRPVRPLRAAPAGAGPRLGGGRGRALAGRAVAAPATRGSPSRTPRRALERACARLRAEPGARRRCRSASRCSASRGCPPASCRSCARWPSTATSTCSCCIPSPALWERIAARRAARRRAARTTTRRGCPRNRLLASWGQDARELQLVLGPDGRTRPSTRSSTASGTLLARAPGRRRATRPGRCRAGARSTDDAASRSTPATAARARSRSCATRSCTCSRTTRRSSRAT